MNAHVPITSARAMGRRGVALLHWTLPGVVLAVLPKCPACFAACAALWTGIGLSLPVALGLRITLLIACTGALVFLAMRLARRLYFRWSGCVRHSECPHCPSSFVIFTKE